MQIIGTCSVCGGPVVFPSLMVNPIPYCQNCGRTPKNKYGPVIDMDNNTKKMTEKYKKYHWCCCNY